MILDIINPANLADPYPLYKYLQENEPVHWSQSVQAWFVTRYADVVACLRDPRLSAARMQSFAEHQLVPEELHLIKDYLRLTQQFMYMLDGAEHIRLRKQANHGFTNTSLDSFRTVIPNVVESLLGNLRHPDKMELISELAEPLASLLLMELFDIPKEDRAKFQAWTDEITHFFGAALADKTGAAKSANRGILAMEEYLERVISLRRKNPGRDLISLLLAYEEAGQISNTELIASVMDLLTAGLSTMKDQFANCVYDLLCHRPVFDRIRQEPTILRSAIEESLRYSPAAPNIYRIAAEDMVLHGVAIKKGQFVFTCLASANRDSTIFENPDRFDVSRQPNRHLSFGIGPHSCVGAGLARRQLEGSIGILMKRFPGLRLSEQHPPEPKVESVVFRTWRTLHLDF